ncbi:hypothetical protein FACS1894142_4570 [Spirochaetia bacterium]|nr:hypothetical protein FACS1894142_4570 [Spirochaetia bacterium]
MAKAKAEKKERRLSTPGVFILYILAAFIGVIGFRLIFPAEAAPLRLFSLSWRFIQGILNYISLFPALAISALVLPLGLKLNSNEPLNSFSQHFSEFFNGPIITAICATVLYGALCFAVNPIVRDREADMRFKGELFRESEQKAGDFARNGQWIEADQMISVCERIWPNSPEVESLRQDIAIAVDEYRIDQADALAEELYHLPHTVDAPSTGGGVRREPVDAAEALKMADTAMQEERYYDAHWLATLGGRLARPGSVELGTAAQLSSRAWNAIASQEPDAREREGYDRYHLKRTGYEAVVSKDWIRAYYIFKQLIALTPGDPDAVNFLGESVQGITETAFFTDELEMTLGEIVTGAMFSIPGEAAAPARNANAAPIGGRIVLRVDSLSAYSDVAYGTGIELLAFDRDGQLLYKMEAPYGKFIPMTLGDEPRVVILMYALDRENEQLWWKPVWEGSAHSEIGDTQIMLNLGYEDFALLSRIQRGTDNVLLGDLFAIEKIAASYGYIPQVFQVAIFDQIAEPVIFLPLTIFGLILGWRYRAHKRPRYIAVPMMLILPLVFNVLIHLCRNLINTLGIWLTISLGFSTALIICIVGAVILFVFALILLAAQHA